MIGDGGLQYAVRRFDSWGFGERCGLEVVGKYSTQLGVEVESGECDWE